jgi:hypothetical protein
LSKTPTIRNLLNILLEYIVLDDDKIVIQFKKPITIQIPGDFEITTDGEVSMLSSDSIRFDSREIHLNSRNCKQIRKMQQEMLDELYSKIGEPEKYMLDFKESLKQEILIELKEDFKDGNKTISN